MSNNDAVDALLRLPIRRSDEKIEAETEEESKKTIPQHLGMLVRKHVKGATFRVKTSSNPKNWIEKWAKYYNIHLDVTRVGMGTHVPIDQLQGLLELVIRDRPHPITLNTAKVYRYRVAYYEEHGEFPATEVKKQKALVKFQVVEQAGERYVGLAAAGQNMKTIAEKHGVEVLQKQSPSSHNKINTVRERDLRRNLHVPHFAELKARLDAYIASSVD